ncbi:HNH endonuclease [Lacibacter sp. H407]|uniref:HNH endonuclease n=1 Tax=Lacibacter sp. H407 TaxID=3133423 RepID=UPI0030C1B08A
MRQIKKPTITSRKVFEDCIDNVNDANFKLELTKSLNTIELAEKDFDEKKLKNETYLIARNTFVNATVNATELKKIYSDRMVNKTNKGRNYYDQILVSAPSGRCPLCNQRIATTLDHYLPKSEYPMLSVCPLNLIPACSDCNKGKLINFPTTNDEETLHPYYDNIENVEWLKCNVIQIKPIIFNYYVDPPAGWSGLLKSRVIGHFKSFKLNPLYTTHALEEFENIKYQLEKLYNSGGAILLKEHLKDCYDSRYAINKNSWQTAFYFAILNNINFCDGHFI